MVPSPSRNAIGFYIGRRADDATTLISRPRALVVSRWIYYDLDEPEEAEAVLLEGCEHAEDLTALSNLQQIFQHAHSFLSSSRYLHDPIFIDKFINIRPTHSQGKLRAIFALSFPHYSYIYKFIDRHFTNRPKNIHRGCRMVPAHPVTPLILHRPTSG